MAQNMGIRLWIIAVHQTYGGAHALEWLIAELETLRSHRTINPPPDVWEVVGSDNASMRRRQNACNGKAASNPIVESMTWVC
jgi:hypothetical protein